MLRDFRPKEEELPIAASCEKRSCCSQPWRPSCFTARHSAARLLPLRCSMLMMRVLARRGAAVHHAGCRCSLPGVPLLADLHVARCLGKEASCSPTTTLLAACCYS
ncbi:hypothetical protein Dimus_022728 [Dionaea muscipula]